MSSFRGLREVMEAKGLFSSLYTDRGTHYWYTEQAGGKVDQRRLTQVHRALQQLGITLMAAYSPEARGRSERVFRTLDDRLPKELALAGITEMWRPIGISPSTFPLPTTNALRGRLPRPGPPSSRGSTRPSRRYCVCKMNGRRQGQYGAVSGPEPPNPARPARFHYVKVTVRVHEYPDGTRAVFHGPRCLARYQSDGRLIEPGCAQPSRRGPTHGSAVPPISMLGQLCATPFQRVGDHHRRNTRTDHVLHRPDKLTYYLQRINRERNPGASMSIRSCAQAKRHFAGPLL
jgi:hypothetical protein